MLPWKRNKFVLVEDEAKQPASSAAAAAAKSLTYRSLLSSLLRSCPELLPECRLRRLAALFHSRRQKVELNKEEPVYGARYLGSVVTIAAKGEGCTQEAVAKLWARSNYGEQSLKTRLSVGPQGIRVASGAGKKKSLQLYSLDRVTCCAADPGRPKILAWVYRHQVKNMAVVLRCHAALLGTAEKAAAAARSLRQHAAAAFSEFRRLKRQSDWRHCRQQLLGRDAAPLEPPLRRLLNGQCHYRSAAAEGLCSITEEDEEEEEGEEEEEEEEKRQKEWTTSTEPTQLLSELDLGEVAALQECRINFVSDANNNTFTFVTSLV